MRAGPFIADGFGVIDGVREFGEIEECVEMRVVILVGFALWGPHG